MRPGGQRLQDVVWADTLVAVDEALARLAVVDVAHVQVAVGERLLLAAGGHARLHLVVAGGGELPLEAVLAHHVLVEGARARLQLAHLALLVGVAVEAAALALATLHGDVLAHEAVRGGGGPVLVVAHLAVGVVLRLEDVLQVDGRHERPHVAPVVSLGAVSDEDVGLGVGLHTDILDHHLLGEHYGPLPALAVVAAEPDLVRGAAAGVLREQHDAAMVAELVDVRLLAHLPPGLPPVAAEVGVDCLSGGLEVGSHAAHRQHHSGRGRVRVERGEPLVLAPLAPAGGPVEVQVAGLEAVAAHGAALGVGGGGGEGLPGGALREGDARLHVVLEGGLPAPQRGVLHRVLRHLVGEEGARDGLDAVEVDGEGVRAEGALLREAEHAEGGVGGVDVPHGGARLQPVLLVVVHADERRLRRHVQDAVGVVLEVDGEADRVPGAAQVVRHAQLHVARGVVLRAAVAVRRHRREHLRRAHLARLALPRASLPSPRGHHAEGVAAHEGVVLHHTLKEVLRAHQIHILVPVVVAALVEVLAVAEDGGEDGHLVVALALVRPAEVHKPGDAALGVLGEVGPGEAEVPGHEEVVRAEVLRVAEARVPSHHRQNVVLLRGMQLHEGVGHERIAPARMLDALFSSPLVTARLDVADSLVEGHPVLAVCADEENLAGSPTVE
mmetsp:Transcript_28711/g.62901  ORF Transcript_28711/g.62901 Transcript_28711/m.62901 type:complete len:669 (+) Transcript_28711:683-2689(+)